MREIKFKVWDVDKKDWYNNEKLPYQFIDNEGVFCWADYYEWDRYPGEVLIMQYTGLKDKNGVEIYEGDVIKTRLNRIYRIVNTDGVDIGCNAGEYEYWVSGFVPAAIDGVIDNSGESEFGYDQFVTGECEVIGNIYEHPHLLEE